MSPVSPLCASINLDIALELSSLLRLDSLVLGVTPFSLTLFIIAKKVREI